jgi:predicted transcriptional regulator
VVANGADPDKTMVNSIMTSPIIVVSPDAKIEEALKVMTANKVRRLPVTDEKAGLTGVVAVSDIARALAEKAGYTSSLITAMTKESTPPSGVYE